jgi:isoleucyl-tRNA synthetase
MSDATASNKDYKETLNLPFTPFKMKAGATTREPEIEAFWTTHQVYEKVQAARPKNNRFLLHDGPPYLSSDKIHIGTALNKILKDIVTKYKAQRGYYSPYVPGYDGHGLPIENAVVKSIKGGRAAVSTVELREQCRAFALKNLKGQEVNFKRLGVWGDWEHPYLTIDGRYEADQIRLFGKMYEKGYVYKGLKPVYWCPSCETALADAEVEYQDHASESIYIRFPVNVPPSTKELPPHILDNWENTAFVIWTTTPWTIPANLGLAVNAEMTYVFLKTASWGMLILAEALLEDFLAKSGITDTEVLAKTTGHTLENIQARHPLYDRPSPVVLGTHVTAEAGTGVVHTAPGHGHDDYLVGQQYNLGILSPVNNKGVFTEEAGEGLSGLYYAKGNQVVIDKLKAAGVLLGQNKISHSYPHCWRCHQPVIYRATEQWFISIDCFRQKALDAIKGVSWIPARGEHRITSMVENRSDWCISRQRVWGVPIPVFYCAGCLEPLITENSIEKVAKLFEQETSDAWWRYEAKTLLNADTACPKCGNTEFTKETDIMDVWFDSGTSHTSVVEARSDVLGHLPVELYLEGSDQHRGWFQSSLLTSVAVNEKSPFKAVLTHGFVLDQDGRKMSKSLGNIVDPNDVIQQLGADVLRLWVASVDYTNDVRIGKENLNQLAEVYRKIRNTIRFMMGNLTGFNAVTDRVPYSELSRMDSYILHRLQQIVQSLEEAFDAYEFHRFYQVLQNFCVTELSALYFDTTKDVLYTAPKNSVQRRGVQTVLFELLSTLTPLLVPIMPHLAEDIWLNIPDEHRPLYGLPEPPISILMVPWPAVNSAYVNEKLEQEFTQLLHLKEAVNGRLEFYRHRDDLGSSLEANVLLYPLKDAIGSLLKHISPSELATLFIVSSVTIQDKPLTGFADVFSDSEIEIAIEKSQSPKCIRCWKYLPSVGQAHSHPELCNNCVEAVQTITNAVGASLN